MGGNRAQARNLGIKSAKGKIVAFIDADCVAPRNWLSLITSHLKRFKEDVGGIGGVNKSPDNSPLIGKAIDCVFNTFIGSLGSASLTSIVQPRYVKELACINSAFWKDVLLSAGGFDEEFDLCEDTNLSHNVRETGKKLILIPELTVDHYRRDNFKSFFRQFFSYGMGRMRSIFMSRKYAEPLRTIPFISILVFPVIFLLWPIPLLLFTCYSSYIILNGVFFVIKKREKRFIFIIPALFITQHSSYLLGMIFGIFKGKWRKKENNSSVLHQIIVNRDVQE